jgi:ABC-type transport system substrate-binding protein/class 3 adenylate cyclase
VAEPREPSSGDPAAAPDAQPPAATPPPSTHATELRTFLIADIRGYTTYTRENGDEAGAALAARFAEIVAAVVTARGGFLLELRGDEALVVFVSARNALRAAMELQARLVQENLPRGVGIGLDAGEAIPVGDGYRGTALNLAARLCAKAGPGETLASEAVIHLAAKVDGITYVDARDLRLKGYADKVRVLGVVPSDRTRGHRVSTSPRFSGLGRNRFVLVAGGAGLVVVLAMIALVSGWFSGAAQTAKGSPSPSAVPLAGVELPALAFYDPVTGKLEATTPFPAPRNIAFAAGESFWILGETPRSLYRIDPVKHTIAQTIPVPVDEPSGFNVDDDFMWVTDLGSPRVIRIDQQTGVHSEFSFALDANDEADTFDVAVGAGSVWLSRPDIPEIVRLNRQTGRIQARIDVYAWGLSYGAGGLWFWHDGEIGLIDPSTNEEVFAAPIQLTNEAILGNIHFGADAAWTASTDTGQVWRVDRTGRQRTYQLQPGVTELAATARTMWVTNEETGKLTGIDLVTGDQNRVIDSGHGIVAVVANDDELMIAVAPTFNDAVGALSGKVLTVGAPGTPWWDPAPDPPVSWNWQLRQALYATCANLVNYPDAPWPDGLELSPEVADLPQVSADGRTYTFTIRPGFQFSPPSNEPVTAETFRYTIERALDPVVEDGAPGPTAFGEILGADRFRAGKAQHVAGLKAAGDQLTIRLAAPAPHFLDRLASSAGCAVPIGTPALPPGINPDPPIAGAGPYYLAQIVPKRYVVMLKNPNYHGSRPQPFDAIAIRMKSASATAIAMVEKGQLDAAMLDAGDPLTGAGSALATEWGPGSANAGDGNQRWFGAHRPNVGYLALNPKGRASRERDVRRAVSLAIDRARLAAVWGDGPGTSLLSSAVRAGEDPEKALPAADIDAARALLKGRSGTVTLLGFPTEWGCGVCTEFERELTRQLAEAGIQVRVQHATDFPADAFKAGSKIDLVALGTGSEWPDPYDALEGVYEDTWLGSRALGRLDRLAGLTGQARVDEAAAFVQQVADRDVLVVPYSHQVYPLYVSQRIGCGFVQPALGVVDLLSLCLR